jgi:hypothetical protein
MSSNTITTKKGDKRELTECNKIKETICDLKDRDYFQNETS